MQPLQVTATRSITLHSAAFSGAFVVTAVAKSIVLFGGAVTALCLVALVGWQTVLCFGSESCIAISLRQVLEAAEIHIGRTYYTASVSLRRRDPLQLSDFLEPILELPAILLLRIALVLHVLFFWYICLIESGPDRW